MRSALLATAAAVMFLILAWIGSYLLGPSRMTHGTRYRTVRAEWQFGLYRSLALAESRYFGYPVCLRADSGGQPTFRTYF